MNRPSRDRVVHILADFITRPTAARKRGDLAQDHIDVAKALRDLVDVAAARAADAIDERQKQREQQRLADLYEARAESTRDERLDAARATADLVAEQYNAAIEERDAAIKDSDHWKSACLQALEERNALSATIEHLRIERDAAIEDRDAARDERDDLAKRFREAIAERDNLDDERKKLIGAVGERQTLLQSIAQQAWPDEHAPFPWAALEKLPDRVRAFRVLWEDKA